MSRVTVVWRGQEWMARMLRAVDNGLAAGAQVAARHAASSMNKHDSQPGEYPGTDTGVGRQSIVAVHPNQLGTPGRAAFGSSVRYMRTLEFGGTITAKHKRYLTIPINDAARKLRRRNVDLRTVGGLRVFRTKSGRLFLGDPTVFRALGRKAARRGRVAQAAKAAREAWRAYTAALQQPNNVKRLKAEARAKLARARLRNAKRIAENTGPSSGALFRLKESVYIPARPWAMRTAREALPQIIERFAKVVKAEAFQIKEGA